MDSLYCMRAEHQSQFIEAICVDKLCTAAQRVLCSLCKQLDHEQCQPDGILMKKTLIDKLQHAIQGLDEAGAQDRFRDFILFFHPQNSDQQNHDYHADQNKMIQQVIQDLVELPFTNRTWIKCFELLQMEQEQPLAVANIQQVNQEDVIDTQVSILENQSYLRQNTDFKVSSTNTFFQIPHEVYAIDCSPSAQNIVCGTGDIIIIYDYVKQKQIGRRLKGHKEEVLSVKYSPNGEFIASGSSDFTIRIWDVKRQQQLGKALAGHKGTVMSVSFSYNGQYLVSGSYDKTIRQEKMKRSYIHIRNASTSLDSPKTEICSVRSRDGRVGIVKNFERTY